MTYSRRDLYEAGEPFGECATARKPGGGYLCGGGGGGSSSSSTSTTNIDKRLAVGDGGFGISADDSELTINAMDGGAIAGAFDATKATVSRALQTIDVNNATNAEGFDKLLSVADKLFNRGESLIGQTQQAVVDAYNVAKTTTAGTIDNRTIIVLAVAGAAALVAMKRRA